MTLVPLRFAHRLFGVRCGMALGEAAGRRFGGLGDIAAGPAAKSTALDEAVLGLQTALSCVALRFRSGFGLSCLIWFQNGLPQLIPRDRRGGFFRILNCSLHARKGHGNKVATHEPDPGNVAHVQCP